jgi:hypothetical protein
MVGVCRCEVNLKKTDQDNEIKNNGMEMAIEDT